MIFKIKPLHTNTIYKTNNNYNTHLLNYTNNTCELLLTPKYTSRILAKFNITEFVNYCIQFYSQHKYQKIIEYTNFILHLQNVFREATLYPKNEDIIKNIYTKIPPITIFNLPRDFNPYDENTYEPPIYNDDGTPTEGYPNFNKPYPTYNNNWNGAHPAYSQYPTDTKTIEITNRLYTYQDIKTNVTEICTHLIENNDNIPNNGICIKFSNEENILYLTKNKHYTTRYYSMANNKFNWPYILAYADTAILDDGNQIIQGTGIKNTVYIYPLETRKQYYTHLQPFEIGKYFSVEDLEYLLKFEEDMGNFRVCIYGNRVDLVDGVDLVNLFSSGINVGGMELLLDIGSGKLFSTVEVDKFGIELGDLSGVDLGSYRGLFLVVYDGESVVYVRRLGLVDRGIIDGLREGRKLVVYFYGGYSGVYSDDVEVLFVLKFNFLYRNGMVDFCIPYRVYYSVYDAITGECVVPCSGGTLLSYDGEYNYFRFRMGNLVSGRRYYFRFSVMHDQNFGGMDEIDCMEYDFWVRG